MTMDSHGQRNHTRVLCSSTMSGWQPTVPIELLETASEAPWRRRARKAGAWRRALPAEPSQESMQEHISLSRRALSIHARTFSGRQTRAQQPEAPVRLLPMRELERALSGTIPGELAALLGKRGEPQPADAPPEPTPGSTEQDVRRLLREATDAFSHKLMGLLEQENQLLAEAERQALLAHVQRLYTKRDIGKGFSSLIHTLWTVLENQDASLDADGLRLFRDTLERLYACPQMSYEHARALRKDLKSARLPVQNAEIRKLLVDAITATRS